ncbi:Uncharacterised protein [Vibrio cholerae]|nr:Uncharacterised protein [Vibrio cholerae]CSC68473.1 Uncharacterised protein [Vibrio cholerae]
MHVTNFTNSLTSNLFDINPSGSRDFTAHHHHASFYVSFASNASFRILLKNRVQHCIRDLVCNFIWMAF